MSSKPSNLEAEIEALIPEFAEMGVIAHNSVMFWLGKHTPSGQRLDSPQEVLDHLRSVMSKQRNEQMFAPPTQAPAQALAWAPAPQPAVNPVNDPNSWFNQPGPVTQDMPKVEWNYNPNKYDKPPEPQPMNVVTHSKEGFEVETAATRKAKWKAEISEWRTTWRNLVASKNQTIAQMNADIAFARGEITKLEANPPDSKD